MRSIKFSWTERYDQSIPNNNFPEETQEILFGDFYDFSDYLLNNNVRFEQENDLLFEIGENDERTGAAYWMISEKYI